MDQKRTAILVVLDGLGDRPVIELGGLTPLQAAKTPNLDQLAAEGQTGLMYVISPGVTPGSDVAHLFLFGYDPLTTYPGRGALEVLGTELPFKPGDVGFRANFATVDSDLTIIDRRAGRNITLEEGRELQKAIDGLVIDGIEVHFTHTVQHRGALVLTGEGLSDKITSVDPREKGLKILESKPLETKAKKTAKVVNKLVQIAHERFRDLEVNKEREKKGLLPANALLLRGPGQLDVVKTLKDLWGVKSAVIAGGALYIGTAKYVGMEHVPVEGQTGTIDTNFDNIAKKTIECVDSGYDFIFVHIKATDNASHDQDAKKKVLAIERSDAMIGKIVDALHKKVVVIVTADHSTPISVGEHTCDPVPVLLWSSFIRADSVQTFSELDAAKGALHNFRGLSLLPLMFGYAGLLEKVGA
ncbi:MAG: 2,3-bisphosphoglycerate-independent phosphoglycerate mutase [Candidatus Thorarchaeota archaeon]